MPICVACERWSPGTFERCPDCSGVLKLEPLWARSSKDPQLTRLDAEAKEWHRLARDGGDANFTVAEAWAAVEDRRRRYAALRLRLLPLLEAQEAERGARLEAGARAAGLTVPAYKTKLAREEQARELAADRMAKELQQALEDGQITRKSYEKRRAEVRSALREQRDAAAAVAEGMSVTAYRSRNRRERRRRERLWGGEQPWLSDPGGWAQAWLISLVSLPIVGVVAIFLFVAFVLTGRSPLAAIAGTIVGGIAGWLLAQAVFFGTWALLDRLAPHSWVIRRIGEPLLTAALMGTVIVPSVIAILVALWLS